MKWTVTILKRQPPSMWFCNRAFINIYFFPSGVTSQSGILRRKWIKCFYQGSNYISGINLHQILMQIACCNFLQNFLFKLSQNVTNDSLVNNVQKDMNLIPYPHSTDYSDGFCAALWCFACRTTSQTTQVNLYL